MPAKALLSRSELAALTGLSPRRISQLATEPDCPHRTVGGELRFSAPKFTRWYAARAFEQGRKSVRPADYEDARARKAMAEAEMAEYDLALRRRELMTTAEGEKVLAEAFQRVRGQLLALPTRAAPDLLGAETLAVMSSRLAQAVADVMQELAKAEDVPAAEVEALAEDDDADAPA